MRIPVRPACEDASHAHQRRAPQRPARQSDTAAGPPRPTERARARSRRARERRRKNRCRCAPTWADGQRLQQLPQARHPRPPPLPSPSPRMTAMATVAPLLGPLPRPPPPPPAPQRLAAGTGRAGLRLPRTLPRPTGVHRPWMPAPARAPGLRHPDAKRGAYFASALAREVDPPRRSEIPTWPAPPPQLHQPEPCQHPPQRPRAAAVGHLDGEEQNRGLRLLPRGAGPRQWVPETAPPPPSPSGHSAQNRWAQSHPSHRIRCCTCRSLLLGRWDCRAEALMSTTATSGPMAVLASHSALLPRQARHHRH